MTAQTTTPTGSVRPGPTRPPGRPRADRQAPPSRLDARQRVAAARRLTAAIGRWYLDAQAGRTDVRQARALLTPRAEQRVAVSVLRAHARHREGGWRPGTRIEVRRVLVHAAGDHYEGLVLLDDGVRTVAVTAVLHATDTGWVVSDLARPDDGLPAIPVPVIT